MNEILIFWKLIVAYLRDGIGAWIGDKVIAHLCDRVGAWISDTVIAYLRGRIDAWRGGKTADVAAKKVAPVAADVEHLKAEFAELKTDVAVLKEDAPASTRTSKDIPQSGEGDDLLLIKVAVVACAAIGCFALWIKSQQKSA